MRKMKNSGIPYAPEIPITWDMIPNKYLFEVHSKKVGSESSKYQLLSLTTTGVKERDITAVGGKVPESYDSYQTVEKGDMIFCLFDLDCSAVFSGLSDYDGMITSAYDVMRPKANIFDSLYSKYWFSYVFSKRHYMIYSQNLRYTITTSIFNSIKTPCPPIEEQHKIGVYLDHKCSEIDSIVRNTEKTIEEYKKLKQSLITEVVTGKKRVAADGVSLSDEPRQMKDSGVEWIGEVPEEWGICKLKLLIKSMESGVSVNASQFPAEGKEFGVLKTSSVSKNYFIPSENKKVDADEYYRVSCPVKADTVIVSRMNTPEMVGAAAYCSENIDHIFLPDRLWQVSFVESTSAKFMWYFLISSYIKSYYSSLAMGTSSSMQNISQSQFSNANVLLPSLDEQQIISAYLDTKCSEIDKLIADKQTLLQELESYKKSLIYECVTGKREVK